MSQAGSPPAMPQGPALLISQCVDQREHLELALHRATGDPGEFSRPGVRDDASFAALVGSIGQPPVLDDEGALAAVERAFDSLRGDVATASAALGRKHLGDTRSFDHALVALSNCDAGQLGPLSVLVIHALVELNDLELGLDGA